MGTIRPHAAVALPYNGTQDFTLNIPMNWLNAIQLRLTRFGATDGTTDPIQDSLAQARMARTYFYERLRAFPAGILESCGSAFFLLIAVQQLQAGPTAKALIAAGGNIGMLLSPWLVLLAQRGKRPSMQTGALLMGFGSLVLGSAALLPDLSLYVFATVVAMACTNAIIPLTTQVYQDNYPARKRGRLVSRSVMFRVLASSLFGWLAGRLLTVDPGLYRLIIGVAALSMATIGVFLWHIPSRIIASEGENANSPLHVFHSMRFLRTDKLLRTTLASWMFMGFANLMMVPLRVEYLANPRYGIALPPDQIALLTIIIPSLTRLLLSPFFGWLFDRLNFFAIRVALNVAFAVSILAFFTGTSMFGLVIGALIFGFAVAGGDILWSLWVTKFAPPDRVADYMSVHTFFTGIRGVLAPLFAFQLVTQVPVATMGLICAVLIGLASLILVPEIRAGATVRD